MIWAGTYETGNSMSDKEQIERLYHEMYRAMVTKDRAELERLHDETFVLIHMTGMHQSKQVYIDSIMDGTLNYFDEKTERLDIQIHENTAVMTGQSRVTAAVFGGGRHTWRLQLKFDLIKSDDGWKLSTAQASTY